MRQRLFGLAASLLMVSGISAYAECVPPPPLADVTTKVDTEGALGKVLQIVGINLKANIEVEKKSIFTQFPNANQMVVALVAIYQYCTQLKAVKTLTDEQKLEKLAAYQTTWLMAAAGPQAIATTADNKGGGAPDKPRSDGKRSDWMLNGAPILRVAMDDTPVVQMKTGKISWADIYLNPVPLWITDMNKSFVIVHSAATEAEGRQRMQTLKVSHPQYDFELYAPYGTNTNYGIMMASWVSKHRAAEALQAAKHIDRTSFIWECRGTGDSC
ncbi:MAG TPA: hypothetical protein VGF53_03550 [Pseudolabrys sp.]|jgi:hypothetical protein